jgi:5-methyltetrahydrofolate--homocysteine methyltransferase
LGLSGLLVKSAQQMVVTAQDLRQAGIEIPLLVGGAALSAKFTAARIAPGYPGPVLYAKDAMTGLDLMNQLQAAESRPKLLARNREIQAHLCATPAGPAAPAPPTAGPGVVPAADVPIPPDLKLHALSDVRVEDIFSYVNPIMLFGKHLGYKGFEAALREEKAKAVELKRSVDALQAEILADGILKPRAVFRFFAAQGDGDGLLIYDSPRAERVLERFDFPRQENGEGLCLYLERELWGPLHLRPVQMRSESDPPVV